MSGTLVVRPDRLLDVVTGDLLADRAVVVEGERVAAVVGASDAPTDATVLDLPGATLLPGLVDCHAHLVGETDSGQGYTELLTRTGAQEAMTGVRNARDTLHAGFTSVRDVGNYRAFVDVALRDAIDAGWLPGPRMMVAGALHRLPRRRRRHQRPGPGRRGARAARAARRRRRLRRRRDQRGAPDPVRRRRPDQADRHRGRDVRQLDPGVPELSEAQIRAAVEEAALHGAKVAAHAHGAEGIKRAVRAGCARSSTAP